MCYIPFLLLFILTFTYADSEASQVGLSTSTSTSSTTSTSQHMTIDFKPLPDGVAYTVDLERASVSPAKKATFYMALKAVHAQLRTIKPSKTTTSTTTTNKLLRQGRNPNPNPNPNRPSATYLDHHDDDSTRSTSLGLIEEADEPLQQQVLSQKRLATYFGTVQLGQCVDKEKTKTTACQGKQKEALTFKMLFDTGSCEFWVPGIGCTKDPKYQDRCQNHRTFDPEQSDSYKYRFGNSGPFQDDQKMCIQYLSGKIEGFMAKDYVCVGALCVSEQVFGMADIIDVPLLDEVVWDGIIGLAFPNEQLSSQGITPLMDNMMKSSILTNNLFAYYIGMNQGAVTFGGVDKKYIASKDDDKFRFAVVTEKTYWTIEIVRISLQYGDAEPKDTGLCASSESGDRCKAIVDTGTYLIYGPQEQMQGDAPLSVLKIDQCEDLTTENKQLPTVIFELYAGEGEDPAKLKLHPHDYVLEFTVPVDANTAFVEEGLNAAKNHLETHSDVDCVDPKNRKDTSKCKRDCVIGIAPDNDPGWTFGQVFLRSFYTVFDRTVGSERVGFLRNDPRIETNAEKPLFGSLQDELRTSDNKLLAKDGKMENVLSPAIS